MGQKLGQHFLVNPAGIDAMISTLDIREEETVIEIGPGRGALTERLIQKMERTHGTLIFIEKDKTLYDELVGKLKAEEADEVARLASKLGRETFVLKALYGDALELLPSVVSALSAEPYILTGNIPYYITGHLLRIIGELPRKPRRAALMVQKEVAERIYALPPRMNRLSASVRIWAEPRMVLTIPPSHFDPPPSVDSAIIALETKTDAPEGEALERYFKLMHVIFQQPRKTLANNLAAGLGLEREEITKKLAPLGLTGNERPAALSTGLILALSEAFSKS